MKFSCDKYVLQQAAASAARAAAAKSPIPTLEGLLIEAGASVRITGAAKRWGSCSRAGRLNFSWRLVAASPAAVDSVVMVRSVSIVLTP